MKTKFDIEELSDACRSEIKRNCASLGIDTAEYKTGVCLLRTDDKFLYIEGLYKINVVKNKDSLHTKINKFMEQAIAIREQILKEKKFNAKQPRILVIEDCYFGFSVWTVKMLAKFATVAYLVFRDWGTIIGDPIQPSSARKKIGFEADKGESHFIETVDGKKKIWDRKPAEAKEQVHNYLEDEFDVSIEDPDCADAFVLAFSGLIDESE